MKVIGVGCAPGMITVSAIDALKTATMVYGSSRAIRIARQYIREGCKVIELNDFKLSDLPEGSVVLSTGDPMLAGLGRKGDEVISGISSFQISFARLGLDMSNASVVDAHAKDRHAAIRQAANDACSGRNVFMLTDPKFDVGDLAQELRSRNIKCTISVCENLGYDDERISTGTPERPPTNTSSLFSVVISGG